MEFKHPKYYKELRKLRNNLDQAISDEASTEATSVRPGPGLKQRDSQVVNQVKLSSQSQAPSLKRQANLNQNLVQVLQIIYRSIKPQAASIKLQAASYKLHDPGT